MPKAFLPRQCRTCPPNDLADETDGLTIRRDDGHAEIFVHAEGFIAPHIDPAQGDVSYLALDGAAL